MENTKLHKIKQEKEDLINKNVGIVFKNIYLKKKLTTLSEKNTKFEIENLRLKLLLLKNSSNI